jgi:signal peptidase I
MSTATKSGTRGSKTGRIVLRTAAALFVISLVVAPTILHNFYGYGISPILSGSMSPFAEPGDAFVTVNRPAAEIKVGDIVTLNEEASSTLFAHRIISIRDFNGLVRVVTKGDANPAADENPYLVSPTTEVPVTIFRLKEIGHALVYLNSLQGRQAGLILVVIANVLALLLAMFKKQIRERNLRAEQIYKDLFAESLSKKAIEIKKMETYKALYAETHAKQALEIKKMKMYKELYAESQQPQHQTSER